jgi:hypothetical protein
VICSFLYRAACGAFQLLALRLRSSEHKELEILVLLHELAIACRQLGRPRPSTADRALLAALSRALPRSAWSAFAVSPKTLLRWHRRLVRRHWTYDRHGSGRPPLSAELQSLIVRLDTREPAPRRWTVRSRRSGPKARGRKRSRLRCMRGINSTTAFGLCTEIGDFHRFEHPRTLTSYLGIVPSEHSSSEQTRRGPITKAGSPHARRLLIEAAHHYRHTPAIGMALARRQDGQDPRACEIAWRAQRRLYHQFKRLRLERGKPANIVTVALARELAAFAWEVAN